LSQLLLSKTGNIEQYNELLDTVSRNAKRLNRLTEDLLDLTKIESQSLQLHTERFNLDHVILNVLDAIILTTQFNGTNVQILYRGLASASSESIADEWGGFKINQIFSIAQLNNLAISYAAKPYEDKDNFHVHRFSSL
jgi:signal transduction histidine kinase